MANRLSRRKLAAYTAKRLLAQDSAVVQQLAALLVAEKRQREVGLLVRDIEAEMAEHGTVLATVVAPYELTAQLEQAVKNMISAKNVIIRQQIDPGVIGGMAVQVPGKRFDGTVKQKISELKAQKY